MPADVVRLEDLERKALDAFEDFYTAEAAYIGDPHNEELDKEAAKTGKAFRNATAKLGMFHMIADESPDAPEITVMLPTRPHDDGPSGLPTQGYL